MDYSDDEQPQASTSTKKWVPTAEKPYKCEVPGCNAAYKQHNGLKYHKTHGKCFSRYGQRDDQQVPYTCYDQELCRKKYRNMNGLRYHYQHSERHGIRGMTMLQDGTHPPFPRLGKNSATKEEEDSPESTSTSSHNQPEQSDSSSGLSEPEVTSPPLRSTSRAMQSLLSMTSTNDMEEDRRFVATPINMDYAEDSVSPFSSSEDSMEEEQEEIKPSPSSTNQLLEAIDFLQKQDEHYQISASLPASQFYLPSGIGPSRTSYRRNVAGPAIQEMGPPAQYHPYPVATRPRSNTNPMISAIRRASF